MTQTAGSNVRSLLEQLDHAAALVGERTAGVEQHSRAITKQLVESNGDGIGEYARYLQTKNRSIDVDHRRVREQIKGRDVLVTGASGCIGSVLIRMLAQYEPAGLAGVGITAPGETIRQAEYHEIDVRDRDRMTDLFRTRRPDVIFHLAAQRHPGLAEERVYDTVSTNVTGTRNVVDAAVECGAERLVFASTGKAVRPHTLDVYAASKKLAEWLVWQAATSGRIRCAVGRFTHVVDNGIVLGRLRRWARTDQPLRLHSPETPFHIQSAVESAQLLLCSMLGCGTQPELLAISDLGWPMSALDLAIGILKSEGRAGRIEIVGPEPGYEQRMYPGLYDPRFCGEITPLFNFTESFGSRTSRHAAAVDHATGTFDDSEPVRAGIADLIARSREPDIRGRLDSVLWQLFDARLPFVPTSVLERVARITEPYRPEMSPNHARVDDRIRQEVASRCKP